MTEHNIYGFSVMKSNQDNTWIVAVVLGPSTQWHMWWKNYVIYINQIRRENYITLSYLHWKHTAITAESQVGPFIDTDIDYGQKNILSGTVYDIDNRYTMRS